MNQHRPPLWVVVAHTLLLVSFLTSPLLMGQESAAPQPEPINVIVWSDGRWNFVESVAEKYGSIIYQKPGGRPIAANENALDTKTTLELKKAFEAFSDACAGKPVDTSGLFTLTGRTKKLFFSIASRYSNDCFQRLHHQHQERLKAGEKSLTGGSISGYARDTKINKTQSEGVVIDNRTIGSSPGLTIETYGIILGEFNQAYVQVREFFAAAVETPALHYEDSWRQEVTASLDVLSATCHNVRQATPPYRAKDAHELLVSAVDDVDHACELARTGFETGDDVFFSQAATHFDASTKKFDELYKLIDLSSKSAGEMSYGANTSDLNSNTDQLISAKCTAEWPGDHRMQLHCKEGQEKGLKKLRARDKYSVGINTTVFPGIRATCREEWPSDFQMRDHCEEKQIEAYVKLHGPNK